MKELDINPDLEELRQKAKEVPIADSFNLEDYRNKVKEQLNSKLVFYFFIIDRKS